MSPVLVTGGAGFIGSHVVEQLLQQGHKVRVLDNLSTRGKSNLSSAILCPANFELVCGDVRDPAVVHSAVAGCRSVVHLAAVVSVAASIADPLASAQHNIMGFVHILNAMRVHGVQRLVYASSAAVYGDGGGGDLTVWS